MTDLAIKATVSADGRQAGAELKKLAGDVGDVKVRLLEAQAATNAARVALKAHTAATVVDAAETTRLKDALSAKIAAETLAARELAAATTALNAHGRAQQQVAATAGQTRAAMTSLGQQLNDVAVGYAAGVPAATIFAQQSGQVAFALQGIGGPLKGLGAFLGGPWGIALTTATVAMSPFIGKLFESGEASKEAIREHEKLAQALEAVQRTARGAGESVAESIRLMTGDLSKQLQPIRDKLAEAQQQLTEARAAAQGATGRVGLQRFALTEFFFRGRDERARGALLAVNQLRVQRDAGETAIADRDRRARVLNDARMATDPEFRVREQANQRRDAVLKSVKDEAEARRQLIAITNDETAALDRLSKLKSGGAAASKQLAEETRRLAEAYNPVLAAQLKYRDQLDDIARAERRGIVSAREAAELRRDAVPELLQQQARGARLAGLGVAASSPVALNASLPARVDLASGLAKAAERASLDVQASMAALASQMAADFTEKVIAGSQVIGGRIGQSVVRSVQRASGLVGLFGGPDSAAGNQFATAFNNTLYGFQKIVPRLDKLFEGAFGKGSSFAKLAGQAAGGAAVGGVVANVFGLGNTGAQLGGAIGASLEKPLGKALEKVAKGLGDFAGPIGTIVGSVIGGLFKPKNPFADTRITTTSTGVDSSIFNQRGAGSAQNGLTLAGAVGSQLSQIAGALGAEIRAGLNLGAIGFSGSEFYFNPTGGDFKGAGVQRFGSAEEAVGAAVASALNSNAIGASPRVQAALSRYASNVNQAVAEALKVRDLEQLLEARDNPFIAPFRDFERQARQRIDVARAYGFEVLEIERLNADQRAALLRDTLSQATGPVRDLLDEFRFGDRATGSVRQQLDTLSAERDRLAGLVRGGDTSQMDALAEVVRRIDDLQREAFGTTGEAAAGRASSAALLQELVDLTEARVRAAAEQAQRAAADQAATMQSMDGTLEDIYQLSRQQLAALQSIGASLAGGGGSYDWGLAESAAR